MNSKIEEFLKELTELSTKYQLYIGGCGCCDSPYIEEASEEPKGKYAIDHRWSDTSMVWVEDETNTQPV